MADKSIEIEGRRMLTHDNGDGTQSIVTTQSTSASDPTVEVQGVRLRIHATGENDPVLGVPTYAFVVFPT